VLDNLVDTAYVDSGIVAAALDVFDCSHCCSFLRFLDLFFDCKSTMFSENPQEGTRT
jgi:hypothetical protein